MSDLEKYLIEKEIDLIEDDVEFCEAEYEVTREYCKEREFELSDEDKDTLRAIGLMNEFLSWRSEFEFEWNEIVCYMDDDIREKVHLELAPCKNREFLQRYLELDPDFVEILKTEFGIEMEE